MSFAKAVAVNILSFLLVCIGILLLFLPGQGLLLIFIGIAIGHFPYKNQIIKDLLKSEKTRRGINGLRKKLNAEPFIF